LLSSNRNEIKHRGNSLHSDAIGACKRKWPIASAFAKLTLSKTTEQANIFQL